MRIAKEKSQKINGKELKQAEICRQHSLPEEDAGKPEKFYSMR
jgi:hypothetical protein